MDAAGFIDRWHRVILLVGGALAVASLVGLWRPGLSDDYSLRTLAGSSSEQFGTLEQFIDKFAGVELAIIVVRSDDALSKDSQLCLAQIVADAEALPAVDSAAAISQAPALFRKMIAESDVVRGLLVSEDGKAASVVLQMRDDSDVGDMTRSETVAALKDSLARARQDFPGHEMVLTGPYVLSYEMTHLVWDDLITFGLWGALAASLVLVLSLGSLKLACYPLLVGVASVALALGASVAMGVNTALNLPMLVLLSAVLTIANCVHLAVGHDETRGNAQATLRRLLRPCVGVVGTTVVGFAALTVSPLQPVRSFSLLMILALSAGLVLSLAGACASLSHRTTRPLLRWPIYRLLRGTLIAAHGKPVLVVVVFAGLGLWGVALTSQLEFNLKFLDNFRPTDEIRTNYEFVQRTLTPMQSIELLIDRRDGGPALTPRVVHAMSMLAEEFEGQGPITRAVSVVDFMTFAGWKLPDTQAAVDQRVALIESTMSAVLGDNPLAAFVNRDSGTLRMGFFANEGPAARDKIVLGETIQRRAQDLLGDEYEVRVTGLYHFYAHVARDLLRDQAVSLLASVVGVFVTMAIVLKSWRLAILGMAPPLFAGASCVGLMALLEVPFNTVTSMMLAIALGIAVDDTIHYLWRYRQCRARGHSVARAVTATHLTIGQACTLSRIVIAAGFAVMGFSRFLPIAYFGGVISVVMGVALSANLVLLPALLLLVDRYSRRAEATT